MAQSDRQASPAELYNLRTRHIALECHIPSHRVCLGSRSVCDSHAVTDAHKRTAALLRSDPSQSFIFPNLEGKRRHVAGTSRDAGRGWNSKSPQKRSAHLHALVVPPEPPGPAAAATQRDEPLHLHRGARHTMQQVNTEKLARSSDASLVLPSDATFH